MHEVEWTKKYLDFKLKIILNFIKFKFLKNFEIIKI